MMKFYTETEARQCTKHAASIMRGETVYLKRGGDHPNLRVWKVRTRKYASLLPHWTTQVYARQDWQEKGEWIDLTSLSHLEVI